MGKRVRVEPSGREFLAEGDDTILDAALRAGLALDYGCSNGNCGQCKARVVSGETRKVKHHDFVLSEADKTAAWVLLCSHAPVTDLVIEAPEAGGSGDIPLQRIGARVKAVQPLGSELRLLHLQTPRTQRLRFLAGQHLVLSAGDDAGADYPIASCPCDDRNLHFHVARARDDGVAARVFGAMKAGDAVDIEGPRGDFVLDEQSRRPRLFIACGNGFAPIKSLIEHAMALNAAEALHLHWIADSPAGHYLANLCRSWTDAWDGFHYAAHVAPDPSAYIQTLHAIAGALDLSACDAYVAGPRTAVAAAGEVLGARGLAPERLHLDEIN